MNNNNGGELPELPVGWVWATLQDIVFNSKGKKPRELFESQQSGLLPYVDIRAFEKGEYRQFVHPDDGVCVSNKDILIVWDGARSGLTGRGTSGILGSTIMALSTKGVDDEYLLQYLRYRYDDINKNTRGTGIPHVDPHYLWSIEVPIPPLPEQHRIVAKIEFLFQEVKTARESLSRIQPMLKSFRQSVLAKAFKGELVAQDPEDEPASVLLERIKTERRKVLGKKYKESEAVDAAGLPELPVGWVWTTADELTRPDRPIRYGILKAGPDTLDGVPYVKINEMKDGIIDVKKLSRCNRAHELKFMNARLITGDILISKDGTIGRIAIVPPELEGGNITQHVLRLSPSDFVERYYLSYILKSPVAQAWMSGEVRGVALKGINVTEFKMLPLSLPPLPEQRRIVSKIEELFAIANQIEQQAEAAKKRTGRMEQAILAKAFRGELVAQDPSDEPASELLERIKKESSKGRKGKK